MRRERGGREGRGMGIRSDSECVKREGVEGREWEGKEGGGYEVLVRV